MMFMRDHHYENSYENSLFTSVCNAFTVNNELIPAGRLLHVAAQKYATNVALIGVDCQQLTYQELYERSLKVSSVLRDQGIGLGDKVFLFAENSEFFYQAYFGILQAGAIAVPINTFLHEQELAYVINDAQAKAIITSDTLVVQVQKLVTLEKIDRSLMVFVPNNFLEASGEHFVLQSVQQDELCILLYTSGTSGKPKGVMLSSRNIMTNAMQCFARFKMVGLRDRERFFCVLPLFHIFAQTTCIWLAMMTGSSVVVVPKIDRKLILEGLQQNPTVFFGFPALYGLLCLMKQAPLDSIKLFISGADAMPDKIRSAFSMIYGRTICIGYGLTEAAPVVGVNCHNEFAAGTVVGKPVAGLDCQIRNDAGDIVPVGEIGTVWLRGDNIMMGYYNAPEMTAQVLVNGWLNTGDLGVLNYRGELAITGRSKDLIIHKGFNIYPQEIENILMSHPQVFKAAVIGRDDALSGQIPVAYVAVRTPEGTKEIEAQLRLLCSQHLALYKVPRSFVCLQDLPMSPTGKIDKKQLVSLEQ